MKLQQTVPPFSVTTLREFPNPFPVHSLMLFCHLLPASILLSVPCKIVFAMPDGLEMWPYHLCSAMCSSPWFRSSNTPVTSGILLLFIRYVVFVRNVQKSRIASYFKGMDPKLSQLMRLWYYHIGDQRDSGIRAVSTEPSLFAHMKYRSRRRVRPNIRHLAQLDGCACAFDEWVYGGRNVPYSH